MNKSILALAIASLFAASSANAADVVLLNLDAPGVGLNSTLPAAPVGGNPGTTRGQQATNVYEFAMKMWGSVVESPVQIKVYASFAPLACTSTSGTLGSAGANHIALLTSGTTSRAYGSALADSLVGYDIFNDPSDPGDITSRFNGNLGLPGCLDGSGWYFGLDGHTPAGKINFLTVVMHEIAHGLGAQGFVNKTNGALISDGVNFYSDPYTQRAYDNVLNLGFEAMSNSQRALAMKTPGRTVWTGPQVNSTANATLNGNFLETKLRVSAPAAVAGDYAFETASFGTPATAANFNGDWVLATDALEAAAGSTTTDGCSPITNGAAIMGKIAMIDRGVCGFVVKVKNAQNAGATGVVILNLSTSAFGPMGGVDASITIPAVQLQYSDVAKMKANAPITGGMLNLPPTKAGMDTAGRTRLYSPWVVATGSTFSHFDTVLSPNVLMEPNITDTLQAQFNVDLTPSLFADIGWKLNPGNGKFANCDTGVDAVAPGGIVLGANVVASSAICVLGSSTRTQYLTCMTNYKNDMLASELITKREALQLSTCIKRQVDQYGR